MKKIISAATAVLLMMSACFIPTNNANTALTEEFTASAEFINPDNRFIWGEDNWNFTYNTQNFNETYTMKDEYIETLKANMTSGEFSSVNNMIGKSGISTNYGMCVLTMLAKSGYINYSDYTTGAKCLNDLQLAKENADVESLINYYNSLQVKDDIKQTFKTTAEKTNEENIKDIAVKLKKSPMVMLDLKSEKNGGIVMIAYNVNYGDWSVDDVHYDGQIETYFPGYSKYDVNLCIYFDSKTFDWTVPKFNTIFNSEKGAKIAMVVDDLKLLNDGGYLRSKFIWGRDNWNFTNSTKYFSSTYKMDSNYLDALKENMTSDEFENANKLGKDFGGTKYGLCAVALLAKSGYIPYDKYTAGAKCLHDLEAPKDNSAIESLLNYYSFLERKGSIQDHYKKIPLRTHKENIEDIIGKLKNSPMVMIAIKHKEHGLVSFLAYDVNYGSWTKSGVNYDGRIEIYNPTYPEYDENMCIYFDSQTYNWTMPGYANYKYNSEEGAVFIMVTDDTDLLNDGGYHSPAFSWSRDNWNFTNTSKYFPDGRYISSDYMKKMRSKVSNKEWVNMNYYVTEKWEGSCHGMSTVALLARAGYLNYDAFTKNAGSLYELKSPDKDKHIESLINYYQTMIQNDVIKQEFRKCQFKKNNKQRVNDILSGIETYGDILIGLKQTDFGHTVMGYAVTDGSWDIDGVNYRKRVEILDPNNSMKYNEDYCIYLDTETYNWIIPAYKKNKISSEEGAIFNCVIGDINIINSGGYLDGMPTKNNDEYISCAYHNGGHEFKLSKFSPSSTVSRSAEENYLTGVSYLSTLPEYAIMRMLEDSKSGYTISFDSYDRMDFLIDYENSMLSTDVQNCKSLSFDPSGYAEFNGKDSDYNFDMVFNEGYHNTDWYRIQVSGKNADKVTLKKEANGYLIEGNKLEDVTITASNDKNSAEASFSTDYKRVFIYEEDENTIGLKVDTDEDGIYETDLNEDFVRGDISGNGKIDLYDAIEIAKSLIGTRKFNDKERNIADFNNDGKVDLYDAIGVAKYMLQNR